MKNLDLENCNIQELNIAETSRINGGSELSEAFARALGYLCHKIVDFGWADYSIDLIS
jgi:hypothetical protein